MKYFPAMLAIALVSCAGTALAQSDPTESQIYQAASSGNLPEAQQMIEQILKLVGSSKTLMFAVLSIALVIAVLGVLNMLPG